MERLTYVEEDGQVLFHQFGTLEDAGVTITQLAEAECYSELEQIADVLANTEQRLARYEDLAEQGRLLELPCKVGDTVYEIIEDDIPVKVKYIGEYEVQDISAKAIKYCDEWNELDGSMGMIYFTKEEAEQALTERQRNE